MNRIIRLLPCLAAVLAFAAWSPSARADERKFTYIEEAKTLPQGSWEFEQWATRSWGVDEGSFWRFDFREEIEYGLTDRLTLAGYLNTAILHASNVPGLEDETEFELEGVSLEAKYKLLDPSTDVVGLLGYAELTVGEEFEVEFKAVASKEIGDFTFAYNLIYEYESEEQELAIVDTGRARETFIINALGGSYHFTKSWAAGVEFLARAVWEGNFEEREATGYFVGPNAHYAASSWWVTFTFLVRTNDADEFTKYEARVIFGFNF
jgi:hypothetical protein